MTSESSPEDSASGLQHTLQCASVMGLSVDQHLLQIGAVLMLSEGCKHIGQLCGNKRPASQLRNLWIVPELMQRAPLRHSRVRLI
ncbi:MAG: hypothetical protein SFH39_01950 [Candidatus Magnetobacterium sp. LHC-1]|nr:hypothetical protein [Nitrospirota bacterium]